MFVAKGAGNNVLRLSLYLSLLFPFCVYDEIFFLITLGTYSIVSVLRVGGF